MWKNRSCNGPLLLGVDLYLMNNGTATGNKCFIQIKIFQCLRKSITIDEEITKKCSKKTFITATIFPFYHSTLSNRQV